jgi:hypothetical protein
MKINETYSHLNGLEYLLVHKPGLWHEIQEVIKAVDAEACKTKKSKEKRMVGKLVIRQGRGVPAVPLVIIGITS